MKTIPKLFGRSRMPVVPVAMAFSLAACSLSFGGSIYQELQERDRYSTLVAAIDAAGLTDALSDADSELTVFAPTNAAFAAVPEDTLAGLLADPAALGGLLGYHVLPQKVKARDFRSQSYTTLAGTDVDVQVRSFWWFRWIHVNSSRVVQADIRANNGRIHGIDELLNPADAPKPSLRELLDSDENGNFTILASLLDDQGLSSVLDDDDADLTLLAPTDEIFGSIPEELLNALLADEEALRQTLLNHVLRPAVESSELEDGAQVATLAQERLMVSITPSDEPDGTPTIQIGGATVIAADICGSNGVLHAIDSVLLIPEPQSIVDVAESRDDLSTFVLALDIAGLTDTFDQTTRHPSYTVFAPNNEAFGALPEGVLDALVADPAALGDVLGLHVVSGRFEASDLRDGQVLHALNGKRLTVSIDDGAVSINNAVVIEPNVSARNGIIHVVGSVIAEDPFTVADLIASKSYLSTLAAALDAASLTGALDGDTELTVLAPLNSAFNRLPEGTVEALLADLPALTNILTYHVVPGAQSIRDLAAEGSPETLQGSEIEVTKWTIRFWRWAFTIYRINGTYVVASNLEADNGVVHVIRGVLLPPAEEGEEPGGGDDDGGEDDDGEEDGGGDKATPDDD